MKRQNIKARISESKSGVFGIVGHVGVGHVHSHSSFVQDDSAGFAVVASILKDALSANTQISHVFGDPASGTVMVSTFGGGVGKTSARRGITPIEAELMQRIVNEDGIFTQKLAIKAFGRMYGQGVTETPVALQGAIALAVLDTFCKIAPERMIVTAGKFPGKIDKMGGMIVDIDGIPVALMLNINGTDGGIGPDEDNEGNTGIGEKGALMDKLGLTGIPTIIVESKAYIPTMAKKISDFTFLIRAQDGVDLGTVATCLSQAAEEYSIPHLFIDDTLPVDSDQLAKATVAIADRIIELGTELRTADLAQDKVRIVAELAKVVSEDAGGVTFMSSSLNRTMRSVGIVPGTAAILSLLVPTVYRDYWKIPVLDAHDVEQYKRIILKAIVLLDQIRDAAIAEASAKFRTDI